MDQFFIDPKGLPSGFDGVVQMLFLGLAYGFILMKAATIISDASELLLLVYNPAIIGGLLLPLLGAVPDAAIILASGFGASASELKDSLKVGVGALAGSTVAVLTLPWAACLVLGRVDLSEDGSRALYNQRPKLTMGCSLRRTGIQTNSDVFWTAVIMLFSGITYAIVQITAWSHGNENAATTAGLVISLLILLAYSAYQVLSARATEMSRALQVQARKHAFAQHIIGMTGLLKLELEEAAGTPASAAALADRKLREVFDRYDEDKSGQLERKELKHIFKELGHPLPREELDLVLEEFGGADRMISFEEFKAALRRFFLTKPTHTPGGHALAGASHFNVNGSGHAGHGHGHGSRASMHASPRKSLGAAAAGGHHHSHAGTAPLLEATAVEEEGEDEEDEGEEEEEDNEHAGLTPGQIKLKAFLLLLLGVGLVTIFSDPMCGIFSELGARAGGNAAFYISFCIAPCVSNASEIISSVIFAGKKTRQSIVMTYSQLLGAATLNNTFCLAIFLLICTVKSAYVSWNFGAEVVAILVVEALVFLVAIRQTAPLWMAILPALLFPASLGIVAGLEAAGMD